jgi:hypothetical protein
VYHEKFLTLGNTEAAPAQKAMTSVIDVIVIATPLDHNSFPSTVNHNKFNPKMTIKESFLEYISVNSRFVNDNREWY